MSSNSLNEYCEECGRITNGTVCIVHGVTETYTNPFQDELRALVKELIGKGNDKKLPGEQEMVDYYTKQLLDKVRDKELLAAETAAAMS